MSRLEQFDPITADAVEDEEYIQFFRLWTFAGRAAMYFCIWAAFIIPVLLVIQARW